MNNENIEYFADTTYTTLNNLFMEAFSISTDTLGITKKFITSLVEDIYANLFTEEEIGEMVAFHKRFEARNKLAQELIRTRVEEVVEQNKGKVMTALGL